MQRRAATSRADSLTSLEAAPVNQNNIDLEGKSQSPLFPDREPAPVFKNPIQGPHAQDNTAVRAPKQVQENVSSRVAKAFPNSTRSTERTRHLSKASRRSSSARLDPRPLPPPAPEGDDDLTSIRLAQGRNALWSPSWVLSPSHPEPELPPSVPDIVSSTPPRGIHSSPSRWRSASKSKSKSKSKSTSKVKKSSPLKPTMSRPDLKAQLSLRGAVTPQTGSGKDDAQPLPFPLDEGSHPARQVPAHDPSGEKRRRERDALREEIEQLKQDLQTVSKENEQIRLIQASGRVISSQDEDAVMDVIQRHMIDAEQPAAPPVSQQLARAALSATGLGLLPFSRPAPLVVALSDGQDYSCIKSHRPVPMTAEQELPYLQLFTPFTVTSTIAILPQLPDQPLRQRRVMTLRSKGGSGLFTAKLELVVDAQNLNILDLKVLALEPAASAELTPFADQICQGACNRSMQRNVGILSWAMGEWYRESLRRARLWSQLDRELAAQPEFLQALAEMRQRKKRRRTNDDDDDGDGDDNKFNGEEQETATVRHYLGQQFFDLIIPAEEASSPSSCLRLEWKIGFDWTGEAQSRVACLVGVPGRWRSADHRDVLGKLPQLFQTLVEGGEDLSTAAKTIVALLVGE